MLFIKWNRSRNQVSFRIPGIQLYHPFLSIPEETGAGVSHSQRIKQVSAKCLIDRHIRQLFDQCRSNFTGEAIHPMCPRLERQNRPRHCRNMLLNREVALLPQGLHALLHGTNGGIIRWCLAVAVRQTAAHCQHIRHCDWSFRWYRNELSVRPFHKLAAFLPLRQVPANGILHHKQAPFIEHHQKCIQRYLGHRSKAKQGCIGNRNFLLHIGISDIPLINRLSPLRNVQRTARDSLPLKTLQQFINIPNR